jgi:hypothetical protein
MSRIARVVLSFLVTSYGSKDVLFNIQHRGSQSHGASM